MFIDLWVNGHITTEEALNNLAFSSIIMALVTCGVLLLKVSTNG